MTIKASSLLAIVVVWGALIPSIVLSPGGWWAIPFALLSTGAIGVSAWRRLGLSRVMAIGGVWGGTAAAIATDSGTTWMAIFAFFTTGAVVYSRLRRDAFINAAGIAATWAVAGLAAAQDRGAAWVCILVFLASGSIVNSHTQLRGAVAIVVWLAAGAVMVATGGWHWLALVAFVLTALTVRIFHNGTGLGFPPRFEWDLFERGRPKPGEPAVRSGRGGEWR